MKKAFALLLALAMALTMAACGSAPASGTSASGSASTPAASVGTTEGSAEYAVILKVLSSQFWQSMRDGIEAKAEELGIKVDIYAANTEEDVEVRSLCWKTPSRKATRPLAWRPSLT